MSAHKESTTILAYGELLWDVLPTGAVLGGAPANFAYRLHTIGHHALPVSKVGKDDLGDRALAQLRDKGVDTSLVQRDTARPTGTVDVTLNERGDASYVINRGVAYDHIELTPELRAAAETCRVLYFGSLIQRETASRTTLEKLLEAAPQALKLPDLNLRRDCYTKETVENSLRRADILKLNDDEVKVVTQLLNLDAPTRRDFCRSVRERYGVKTTIVTLASDGVYAWSEDGGETIQPGYVVSVADTIGSGDSFTAGFVDAFLKGADLRGCCEAGNRLGALVAGKKGGMCSIAREEIANFALPQRSSGENASSAAQR